jgi:hypothetical protein
MNRIAGVLFVMLATGSSFARIASAQNDPPAGEIAALRRELGVLAVRQQQQIDALQRQVRALSAELARHRAEPTSAAAVRFAPAPAAPRVAETRPRSGLPTAPKPEEVAPVAQMPMLPPQMYNLPGRSVVPPYTGAGPGEIGPAPVTPAAPLTSGGNKVMLSLSGQVNRALLWGDDGVASNLRQVDNNNSSTRFRIVGEARPLAETVAGMNLEAEFRPNSSATQTLTQNLPQPASAVTFTVRQAEIYGANPNYGGLRLGFGSTASYLTAEVDISSTAVASYEIVGDYDGGFAFRQRAAALVPGGVKGALVLSPANAFGPAVGSVFASFDGLGRDVRLRYDSPLWEGFQFATSVLDGGAFDFAGRFAREYEDFRIASALGLVFANSRNHSQPGAYGYAGVPAGAGGISLGGTNAAPNSPTVADTSASNSKQIDGSLSILLKSGLNLTVAGGIRDPKYHDPTGATLSPDLIYIKLGYQQKFVPVGLTAFSVDYAQNDNVIYAKDHARAYGIQAVQNIDEFGLELYVSGRYETLDRAFASYHPIKAMMTGGRVRF